MIINTVTSRLIAAVLNQNTNFDAALNQDTNFDAALNQDTNRGAALNQGWATLTRRFVEG